MTIGVAARPESPGVNFGPALRLALARLAAIRLLVVIGHLSRHSVILGN